MGKIILEEQTAPDTPASDKVAFYPKVGGEFYRKNDAGEEDQLLTDLDVETLVNTILCHDGEVITHAGNVVMG